MGRPRTSDSWRERIKIAYAAAETTGGNSSAAAIARELEDLGRPDCPSRRTIQRIIEDFKRLPDDARREYSVFRWPQSMEQGALPWEASRSLLDLQLDLLTHRAWDGPIDVSVMPVRFARWYWRACQAMGEDDIDQTIFVAARLTYWEITGEGRQKDIEALHWYLVYAQWRSQEHMERWDRAVNSGNINSGDVLPRMYGASLGPEWDDVLDCLGMGSPRKERQVGNE